MLMHARKILFSALLLALPALGWAGDSYEHRVDEAKNALGANRCADSRDCDGKRTCSPHGWCQGTARPKAVAPALPPRPAPPIRHQRLPRPGRPMGAAELAGTWKGSFLPKGRGDRAEAKLNLRAEGVGLLGIAHVDVHVKRDGIDTQSYLNQTLEGRISKGNRVRLRVIGDTPYIMNGKADKDGNRISGTWSQGKTRGTFVLERTMRADGSNVVLSEGAKTIMNGRWVCEWQYDGGEYGPTPFTLDLLQDQGRFKGSSEEPNTFPKTKLKIRKAEIQDGILQPDGKLSWHKRYDGAEGIGHLVVYSGQLDNNGQTAKGTWQIPGKNKGTWHMRREGAASPQPPQPAEVPTAVPSAPSGAPTPATEPEPTPLPTATPALDPGTADAPSDVLGGPWSGMAHPKSGGLTPVTLNLVLAPRPDGTLKGHGIVIVRGGKPRERNVEVVEGSYKEDGSLKFSLHFSEPEEEDLNMNFRGLLHKNERLIKGDWDHSGSGLGNFELHYREGGQ